MSCLLLAALALTAPPAQAQGGNPGQWTVTGADGNSLYSGPDGYFLNGYFPVDTTEYYPGLLLQAYNQNPGSNIGLVECYFPSQSNDWGCSFYGLAPDGEAPPNSQYASSGVNDFLDYPANGAFTQVEALNAGCTQYGGSIGSYTDPTTGETAAMNGSVFQNVTGQALAYWTWTGSGPPPPYINLLLTTYVSASASVDYEDAQQGDGLSANATVSDGFGESVTASAGDGAQAPSNPAPITGKHLVRAAVAKNQAGDYQAEVYLNSTSTAYAGNDVPYSTMTPGGSGGTYNGETEADASAYVNASAQMDSRDVTISCPTIETSYYKSWIMLNGVNTPVAVGHQRAADGSMLGDSVLTYMDNNYPYYGAGWQIVPVNFVGNVTNFQDPTYSWSITSPGAGAGTGANNGPDFEASVYEANGSSLPVSTTTTLTATDSDGTTGSNTYTITWHLPSENWGLASLGESYSTVFPSTGPPSPTPWNDTGSGQWSFIDNLNGSSVDLSAMFNAAGGIGAGLLDPPWAAFVAAAGITLGAITAQPSSVTSVFFNAAWTQPQSTFSPAPPDNTVATMQTYQMQPELEVTYVPENWTGDGYNVNGYNGPVTETYDHAVSWAGCGKFTLLNP